MSVVRRLVGILCGTAGLIGLILCVAGLVGCWIAYSEVVAHIDRLFDHADQSLRFVDDNLDQVRARLRQTQSELEAVRVREAEPQPAAERNAKRALSRKAVEAMVPQLGDARTTLVKATEAALVANGLLEALADLPILELANVDTDKLKEASTQLAEVSERSSKLAAILGRPTSAADSDVVDESSKSAEVLHRTIAFVDAGSDRLNGVRERIAERRRQIMRWINGIAGGITVLLVWIAAGQVSLLIHGKKLVWRGSAEDVTKNHL